MNIGRLLTGKLSVTKKQRRRRQANKMARKHAQRMGKHWVGYDPDDTTEHLFATAREHWWPLLEGDSITTLIEDHKVYVDGKKMLLKGNMFVGEAAHILGGKMTDGMLQIVPIELLDNKELLAAAFQLWDPTKAGDTLYADFHDAIAAAKRLLQ